jgi:hypothetical protein
MERAVGWFGLTFWMAVAGLACGSSSGMSVATARDSGADTVSDTGTTIDSGGDISPDSGSRDAETDVFGGDVSTEDAVTVDAGDAGGEVRPPMTPRIISVAPSAPFRGDQFVVEGTDLVPLRRAVLGTVELEPIANSATTLTFKVPTMFPLSSCAGVADLVIETAVGESSAVPVQILDPGPSIGPIAASIPAGTALTLSGCNLATARATLSGQALAVQAGTATTLTVTIPRDASTGVATLVVANDRGLSQFQITVLPPTPQVLATDLQSVSTGGVLFITTDAQDKRLIDSVRVGDVTLSVSDPASAVWTDQGSTPTMVRLAIRIPTTVVLGNENIALNGSSGMSVPYPVTITAPTMFAPPGAGPILLTPSAVADDGSFPIGTQGAFRLGDPGVTAPSDWSYVFSPYDSSSTPSDIATCTGIGTIKGTERHTCPGCEEGSPSGCGPTNYDRCHPFTGTYIVSSKSNVAMVTIDRTSSGGVIEEYVGGWVTADGTLPGPNNNGSSWLVLRSLRTGIQLSIRHGLRPRCSPS